MRILWLRTGSNPAERIRIQKSYPDAFFDEFSDDFLNDNFKS